VSDRALWTPAPESPARASTRLRKPGSSVSRPPTGGALDYAARGVRRTASRCCVSSGGQAADSCVSGSGGSPRVVRIAQIGRPVEEDGVVVRHDFRNLEKEKLEVSLAEVARLVQTSTVAPDRRFAGRDQKCGRDAGEGWIASRAAAVWPTRIQRPVTRLVLLESERLVRHEWERSQPWGSSTSGAKARPVRLSGASTRKESTPSAPASAGYACCAEDGARRGRRLRGVPFPAG
jgi:hypothetical protein